jgi:hypothetical protein
MFPKWDDKDFPIGHMGMVTTLTYSVIQVGQSVFYNARLSRRESSPDWHTQYEQESLIH